MTAEEIQTILQEHLNHLRKMKSEDKPTRYWVGAIDCVEILAEKLGVDVE